MAARFKNPTFSLSADITDKLEEYPSKNNMSAVNLTIPEAMQLHTKTIEKENLYREMKEASKDPLFLEDSKEIMDAFTVSDDEVSGRIPQW